MFHLFKPCLERTSRQGRWKSSATNALTSGCREWPDWWQMNLIARQRLLGHPTAQKVKSSQQLWAAEGPPMTRWSPSWAADQGPLASGPLPTRWDPWGPASLEQRLQNKDETSPAALAPPFPASMDAADIMGRVPLPPNAQVHMCIRRRGEPKHAITHRAPLPLARKNLCIFLETVICLQKVFQCMHVFASVLMKNLGVGKGSCMMMTYQVMVKLTKHQFLKKIF